MMMITMKITLLTAMVFVVAADSRQSYAVDSEHQNNRVSSQLSGPAA